MIHVLVKVVFVRPDDFFQKVILNFQRRLGRFSLIVRDVRLQVLSGTDDAQPTQRELYGILKGIV